jgi:hypothetical protein
MDATIPLSGSLAENRRNKDMGGAFWRVFA